MSLPLPVALFPRAMSQAAALARIVGECRGGAVCRRHTFSTDRNGVQTKYPAPWSQKNKLGHAP